MGEGGGGGAGGGETKQIHGDLERVLQPKLGEQCFKEDFPNTKLNLTLD